MSFKPKNAPKFTPREFVKLPKPEAGNQTARVSLIVDAGEQLQWYEDSATKERKLSDKTAQEVIVFADLVDQEVDYGGDIGVKQYRIMLNDQWFGEIKAAKFSPVIPRDAEGNIIKGKLATFHPRNLLYRLAIACGKENILGKTVEDNMDIEQLLGAAFMLDVEVTEQPDKNGKKDDKGEVIVYTNVKGKAPSRLPIIKGKPIEATELTSPAMLITFETATEEQVSILRRDVLRKIQKAVNYQGSQIQAVMKKLGLEEEGVAAPAVNAPQVSDNTTVSDAEEFDDIPFEVEPSSDDSIGDDDPFGN